MKLAKKIVLKGNVWRWPGEVGWHFFTFDRELSAKINQKYPKGFVKVEATVGKSKWATSLFPQRRDKTYLLCINKKIRKIEQIFEGDEVTLVIKIL